MSIINKCRLCKSKIKNIVDIGNMALSGVFPKLKNELIKELPLILCKCDNCHLVQLRHDFDLNELYGNTYGYCSSLNNSMVNHLKSINRYLESKINLKEGDVIIDIGANDGTLLNNYQNRECEFYGIDPCSYKFKENYKKDIMRINNFFSEKEFRELCKKNVKVISTISMFYDLPDPLKFSKEICNIMDDDGIWFMEHSYLPTMIKRNSFDTICHEHVEYYSLQPILYIIKKCDLKIIDINFNLINGGSFNLLLCKKDNLEYEESNKISKIMREEENFFTKTIFNEFNNNINESTNKILELLKELKKNNKEIHGYGASTKGNILLQYCNIDEKYLTYIAEVNPYKYGRFTPGTKIPIISEEESKKMKPDYYFVLPWHYKDNILKREKEFLNNGGKIIFPLPKLEIIEK